MDESIFIDDSLVRRKMWTADRIIPIITITGSHQRTCVFGTLCIDRRQFFRQYESFNQYTFLDYLIQMQKKVWKTNIVHRQSTSSSELSAIEECWRQGKYDLLVSKYYPNFANFRHTIANYYRTRRFKLDIVKYLSRSVS